VRYPGAALCLCLLVCAQRGHGADEPSAGQGSEAAGVKQEAAASQERKFNIWELQVEGNTVLPTEKIERAVYPFVGPDKTIQDVESAQHALEVLYRDAGYPTVVVDIPEQDVTEGIVRLRVVQGTVSRVRVTGSRYFSLGRIRSGVPAVAQGEVPYLPALQEQIKQINQTTPDRTVTPIFRPGRTPGTVEVELRVKDEFPLHGDVELDNRYSKDTTKLRASTTLRYANLWQREHSASLMYQTSPEDTSEVRALAGTYVVPLGGGDALAAYAVDSKSNVATAGALSVLGNSRIYGARFVKSLAEQKNDYHSATFGMDYKNTDQNVSPEGGGGEADTPVNYTQFLAQYRGTLAGQDSRLSFGFSANFAPRGMGNSESEFENARYKAKPNYLYIGSFGEYTRDLDRGMQLRLAFDGQLSDSPLVDNEEFMAGGADSVRGYYESQVLGDDGITVNAELYSPSFASLLPYVSDLRFLAFFDGSRVRVLQPLPGQKSNFTLDSTGVGLRIKGERGLAGSLDWAWPLHDDDGVNKGDSRALFSLNYGF
jgi:hemolysin activation/secretion protein